MKAFRVLVVFAVAVAAFGLSHALLIKHLPAPSGAAAAGIDVNLILAAAVAIVAAYGLSRVWRIE